MHHLKPRQFALRSQCGADASVQQWSAWQLPPQPYVYPWKLIQATKPTSLCPSSSPGAEASTPDPRTAVHKRHCMLTSHSKKSNRSPLQLRFILRPSGGTEPVRSRRDWAGLCRKACCRTRFCLAGRARIPVRHSGSSGRGADQFTCTLWYVRALGCVSEGGRLWGRSQGDWGNKMYGACPRVCSS